MLFLWGFIGLAKSVTLVKITHFVQENASPLEHALQQKQPNSAPGKPRRSFQRFGMSEKEAELHVIRGDKCMWQWM